MPCDARIHELYTYTNTRNTLAKGEGDSALFLKKNKGRCPLYLLIDQALYIDIKMRLLNLTLPLSDKMSIANSVEVRPLFLDHDFVNFTFGIPHHYINTGPFRKAYPEKKHGKPASRGNLQKTKTAPPASRGMVY